MMVHWRSSADCNLLLPFSVEKRVVQQTAKITSTPTVFSINVLPLNAALPQLLYLFSLLFRDYYSFGSYTRNIPSETCGNIPITAPVQNPNLERV